MRSLIGVLLGMALPAVARAQDLATRIRVAAKAEGWTSVQADAAVETHQRLCGAGVSSEVSARLVVGAVAGGVSCEALVEVGLRVSPEDAARPYVDYLRELGRWARDVKEQERQWLAEALAGVRRWTRSEMERLVETMRRMRECGCSERLVRRVVETAAQYRTEGKECVEVVLHALSRGCVGERLMEALEALRSALSHCFRPERAREIVCGALDRGEHLLACVERAAEPYREYLGRLATWAKDLAESERRYLAEILAGARESCLPVDYLESKVREGLCKHVRPAQLVNTLRQRTECLRSFEAQIRVHAGADVSVQACRDLTLELQHATDLGLSRNQADRILAMSLRSQTGARADVPLVVDAVRFAGTASAAHLPESRVLNVVQHAVAAPARQTFGNQIPPPRIGMAMENGFRQGAVPNLPQLPASGSLTVTAPTQGSATVQTPTFLPVTLPTLPR